MQLLQFTPSRLVRDPILRIAVFVIAAFLGTAGQQLQAAGDNHRMILLTDLLGEQDDSQMIIRLLMYANEMDI